MSQNNDAETVTAAATSNFSATPAAQASAERRIEFDTLNENATEGADVSLDMILDVPVTLAMEVGRTRISIRNLLQLNQGSVVELDRAAGEPNACASCGDDNVGPIGVRTGTEHVRYQRWRRNGTRGVEPCLHRGVDLCRGLAEPPAAGAPVYRWAPFALPRNDASESARTRVAAGG